MRQFLEDNNRSSGFTMIEMVVVIVVMGILAAVAVPMIGSVSESAKYAETRQEMEALGAAIRGISDLYNNGTRAGFGYVGDIGALPSNLDALFENPGGFGTWKGPYISNSFREISGDFKTDAWQSLYSYNGGINIISVGSGDTIVYSLAPSIDELLFNSISGNIVDLDHTPPPRDFCDSFLVRTRIPDGAGDFAFRTAAVVSGGYFSMDSIPIGRHTLEAIYLPLDDTARQYLTVVPRGDHHLTFRMQKNLWYDETTIVPAGLAGYWRFNQSSGTMAYDESGGGNDGTLYNMAPGSDWITGKAGNGLNFDGIDDYLDCGDGGSLELPQLSIACWVRTTQSGNYCQIAGKNRDGSTDSYYFALHNMKPAVFLGGTSDESWHVASSAIIPAQWNHIAFTYDGSQLIIYINGAVDRVVGSVSGAVNANSGQDFWIGSRADISGREFEGTLDEVRIYDRALSGSEISQLFNM